MIKSIMNYMFTSFLLENAIKRHIKINENRVPETLTSLKEDLICDFDLETDDDGYLEVCFNTTDMNRTKSFTICFRKTMSLDLIHALGPLMNDLIEMFENKIIEKRYTINDNYLFNGVFEYIKKYANLKKSMTFSYAVLRLKSY